MAFPWLIILLGIHLLLVLRLLDTGLELIEQVAREIGVWLRRGLAGQNRGSSGRGQVALASRVYLVVRDVRGNEHSPPLVFTSWSAAKRHCVLDRDGCRPRLRP